MRRSILSALFLLTTIAAFPQMNTTVIWHRELLPASSDSIHYIPGAKLSWDDFRGRPDQRSSAAAITASGFGYTMDMKSVGRRATLVITVYCYFQRNSSWVKRGLKSDYALLHEQHHFDITYLVTASFISKLKNTAFSMNNYESLLEKINNEHYAELERMQNAYDGETRNGLLKVEQAEWNVKINKMLSQTVIN